MRPRASVAGEAARGITTATISNKAPTYTSLRQATASLLREEGIRTLWRGNTAAMALWIAYSAIQFPVYR